MRAVSQGRGTAGAAEALDRQRRADRARERAVAGDVQIAGHDRRGGADAEQRVAQLDEHRGGVVAGGRDRSGADAVPINVVKRAGDRRGRHLDHHQGGLAAADDHFFQDAEARRAGAVERRRRGFHLGADRNHRAGLAEQHDAGGGRRRLQPRDAGVGHREVHGHAGRGGGKGGVIGGFGEFPDERFALRKDGHELSHEAVRGFVEGYARACAEVIKNGARDLRQAASAQTRRGLGRRLGCCWWCLTSGITPASGVVLWWRTVRRRRWTTRVDRWQPIADSANGWDDPCLVYETS